MVSESVSIIVTTRNNSSVLGNLLESIRHQTFSRYSLIVVDNYSSDGTPELALQYGATVIQAGPERSAQRNAGAEMAKSTFLLFLDSDMELTPKVLEVCLNEVAGFGALAIREVSVGGYWARVRNFERNCLWGEEIIDVARFVRRDLFLKVGGYDTEITGMEDFDLQTRVVEAGFKVGSVEEPIIHHEEGIQLLTYLKKRRYYGSSDKVFKRKHPQAWKRITSPIPRMVKLLRCDSQIGTVAKMWLFTGYFIMRGFEYSVRVLLGEK